MLTINFKAGNTFRIDGAYQPDGTVQPLPTGIRAQLRDQTDGLVAELTVTRVDEQGGKYRLTFGDTSAWPPGRILYGDVLFTDSTGAEVSTVTFAVNVIKAITHD